MYLHKRVEYNLQKLVDSTFTTNDLFSSISSTNQLPSSGQQSKVTERIEDASVKLLNYCSLNPFNLFQSSRWIIPCSQRLQGLPLNRCGRISSSSNSTHLSHVVHFLDFLVQFLSERLPKGTAVVPSGEITNPYYRGENLFKYYFLVKIHDYLTKLGQRPPPPHGAVHWEQKCLIFGGHNVTACLNLKYHSHTEHIGQINYFCTTR